MKRAGVFVLLLWPISLWTQAQESKLQFEVASIKPAAPPVPSTMFTNGGDCHWAGRPSLSFFPVAAGRCRYVGVSLARLINIVYPGPTVEGGPGWTRSDLFDIEAEAPDPSTTTRQQLMEMFQQLLSDRFQLRFHRINKEVNGYSLVISKSGLKMKPIQPGTQAGLRGNAVSLTGNGPVSAIEATISRALGVPVRDETGLKGSYEVSLTWTSDPPPGPAAAGTPPDPTGGPSIFTAVQEQLGLRLEPTKISVDSIVIDSAQKPSSSN